LFVCLLELFIYLFTYLFIYFFTYLFIYIFIYLFERCTEEKLVTEWAKNLSYPVTSFRH